MTIFHSVRLMIVAQVFTMLFSLLVLCQALKSFTTQFTVQRCDCTCSITSTSRLSFINLLFGNVLLAGSLDYIVRKMFVIKEP